METTLRSPIPANSGATGKPEGALNMASSGAHAAVDSIAGFADDAARKAKPAIDGVAAMAHQAVDKVAGAAAPTAEWLTEHGKSLQNTQKKLMHDTCSYISTNPLTSIAIAVAAGFLISRVTR
jgi:ElaB/YqjD/DUF883 family membrane-anchored ribosome-binding protein